MKRENSIGFILRNFSRINHAFFGVWVFNFAANFYGNEKIKWCFLVRLGFVIVDLVNNSYKILIFMKIFLVDVWFNRILLK